MFRLRVWRGGGGVALRGLTHEEGKRRKLIKSSVWCFFLFCFTPPLPPPTAFLRLPSSGLAQLRVKHLFHSLCPCQESSYSCSGCMLPARVNESPRALCAGCGEKPVWEAHGGAPACFFHTRLCGEPSENRAHSRVGISFQTKTCFLFVFVGNKAFVRARHALPAHVSEDILHNTQL